MSDGKCHLHGGGSGCVILGRGLYKPETEQAKDACNRAKGEAAWRLGGALAGAFAMYAAWKYVKPEGMLSDVLGRNISSWARPGLVTFAGLGTALTLVYGVKSGYRAHRIPTEGAWLNYCFTHKIWA